MAYENAPDTRVLAAWLTERGCNMDRWSHLTALMPQRVRERLPLTGSAYHLASQLIDTVRGGAVDDLHLSERMQTVEEMERS